MSDLDAKVVVVSLQAARDRLAPENLQCRCGGVWFQPRGVTIDANTASVSGYAFPIGCVECGSVIDGDAL